MGILIKDKAQQQLLVDIFGALISSQEVRVRDEVENVPREVSLTEDMPTSAAERGLLVTWNENRA